MTRKSDVVTGIWNHVIPIYIDILNVLIMKSDYKANLRLMSSGKH